MFRKNMIMVLAISCIMMGCTMNALIPEDSLQGNNYTKGQFTSRKLHLTFLKDNYRVEKRPESDPLDTSDRIALPYEMYVRAFIVGNKGVQKKIDSLDDLEGFVKIDNKAKAIEFVRFRTSAETYFLFRPEIMIEVHKQEKGKSKTAYLGGCSKEFFDKFELTNLHVEYKKDYFEIRRYLVHFSWPGSKHYPSPAALYYAVEKVFQNGRYIAVLKKIMDTVDYSEIPYPLEPS